MIRSKGNPGVYRVVNSSHAVGLRTRVASIHSLQVWTAPNFIRSAKQSTTIFLCRSGRLTKKLFFPMANCGESTCIIDIENSDQIALFLLEMLMLITMKGKMIATKTMRIGRMSTMNLLMVKWTQNLAKELFLPAVNCYKKRKV